MVDIVDNNTHGNISISNDADLNVDVEVDTDADVDVDATMDANADTAMDANVDADASTNSYPGNHEFELLLSSQATQEAQEVAENAAKDKTDIISIGSSTNVKVDADASTDNYPGDEEFVLLLSSQAALEAQEVVKNAVNNGNDHMHITNNAEGSSKDPKDDTDNDDSDSNSNTNPTPPEQQAVSY